MKKKRASKERKVMQDSKVRREVERDIKEKKSFENVYHLFMN
jgi:hypothetical protein